MVVNYWFAIIILCGFAPLREISLFITRLIQCIEELFSRKGAEAQSFYGEKGETFGIGDR